MKNTLKDSFDDKMTEEMAQTATRGYLLRFDKDIMRRLQNSSPNWHEKLENYILKGLDEGVFA